MPVCNQCGVADAQFICQGCMTGAYCSETCQREAWTNGKHRLVCTPIGGDNTSASHGLAVKSEWVEAVASSDLSKINTLWYKANPEVRAWLLQPATYTLWWSAVPHVADWARVVEDMISSAPFDRARLACTIVAGLGEHGIGVLARLGLLHLDTFAANAKSTLLEAVLADPTTYVVWRKTHAKHPAMSEWVAYIERHASAHASGTPVPAHVAAFMRSLASEKQEILFRFSPQIIPMLADIPEFGVILAHSYVYTDWWKEGDKQLYKWRAAIRGVPAPMIAVILAGVAEVKSAAAKDAVEQMRTEIASRDSMEQ